MPDAWIRDDVHLGDRSDAELMALARDGWAPAFAVLLHRHAGWVHAAVADRPDPAAAVADVFARAQRTLGDRDPDAPVRPWLLELAEAPAPAAPQPLPPEQLDAIWARCHAHWRDRARGAGARPWARAGALVAGVAVAALLPVVLLGGPADVAEREPEELRAVPADEHEDPDRDGGGAAGDDIPADVTLPGLPEGTPERGTPGSGAVDDADDEEPSA